jgi:hypothetical protein
MAPNRRSIPANLGAASAAVNRALVRAEGRHDGKMRGAPAAASFHPKNRANGV